jgi:glycosyltransferase involved in cell wall biosynthesis
VNTRFGFVSTYPPTQCGLATFTSALRSSLIGSSQTNGPVVRLLEAAEPAPSNEVVAQIVMDDPVSQRRGIGQLNDCDIAVVQHEYGVYGGPDGDEVLSVMDGLMVPSIVVLHTVLSAPTVHQREVLEAVVARADVAVVMTRTARDRLVAGYRVHESKVRVIPHGVDDDITLTTATTVPTARGARPTVLTWGLLGPGKGIEWGIEAIALLGDLQPAPHYIVAGQTHPKVLAHQGDVYRERLVARVAELGLQASITFEGHYLHPHALARLVRSADVVLLPYDSTEQVTSGVLIEAVAAGRPVVATGFPHARELLSDGSGILVPHHDPQAIADALRAVITEQDLASAMVSVSASRVQSLRWSAVAEQYREVAHALMSERVAV